MSTAAPRSDAFRQTAACVLLCAACGLVDAIGFLGHGIFAANMTGNTVLLGLSLAERHWDQALGRLWPLIGFFAGALTGRLLVNAGRGRFGIWVLVLEAATLAATAAIDPRATVALWVIAFAMGLQATAVPRFRGLPISTVVITSTMARGAEALVDGLWRVLRPQAPAPAAGWDLLLLSWTAYLLGAVVAGLLPGREPWGFGAAAALVAVAAALLADWRRAR